MKDNRYLKAFSKKIVKEIESTNNICNNNVIVWTQLTAVEVNELISDLKKPIISVSAFSRLMNLICFRKNFVLSYLEPLDAFEPGALFEKIIDKFLENGDWGHVNVMYEWLMEPTTSYKSKNEFQKDNRRRFDYLKLNNYRTELSEVADALKLKSEFGVLDKKISVKAAL